MQFIEYLSEKASYNRTISQLMSQARIPLTDTITKLLGFGRDAIVFHATTLEHLKGLKSLGKSKKQISTFTKGLGSLIPSISIKPDIVAKLEGRSVIDFEFDIFSHPDQQGRRWIGTRGSKKSDFLQEALNKKVLGLMYDSLVEQDEELQYDREKFIDELTFDGTEYVKYFDRLSSKNKQLVIKLYIDNATNLMKNAIYTNIVKEIIAGSNKKVGKYDEIIMNKFKVLGVYSLETGRYLYNHSMAQYDIEKYKYKYLGHVSKDEFSTFSIGTH